MTTILRHFAPVAHGDEGERRTERTALVTCLLCRCSVAFRQEQETDRRIGQSFGDAAFEEIAA